VLFLLDYLDLELKKLSQKDIQKSFLKEGDLVATLETTE
jgi:hypothetical protein